MSSIAAQIASLTARITALENRSPPPKPLPPPSATDAFASHQSVALLAASQTDFLLTRAPPPYYTWRLDERRAFLSAPSTRHLCKSIVMRNTAWNAAAGDARLNAQYYCCIVSYTTKLSSAGLTRILRQACLDAGTTPPPKKEMHFRLADDCVGVTGYEPNGVTPVGLKTPMPTVLDKELTLMRPRVFWCGGGEVSLKLRLNTDQFIAAFDPIVATISD